ncbi:MAG: response regulator transcription factor [Clostridia bacterium]|nr:response regulator transcription factor [Clostridia bacterium]
MIYYVEDDASIRNLVVYTLSMTGFPAKGFERSAPFWAEMQQEKADLILLDLMLPGENGLSILRELKTRRDTMGTPVILITAKDGEDDVVQGLELGADDYIAKPFGIMELIARVKAVLRRCGPGEEREIIEVDEIRMDTGRHTVQVSGREIALTLKEYELLRVLMQKPGRLIEREALIDAVWSRDYMGASHTLDAHIQTLRSKLGSSGSRIQTVYGCGYRICPSEAAK